MPGETVTVIRPAYSTDPLNNAVKDWGNAVRHAEAGVMIAPRTAAVAGASGTREIIVGREGIIAGWELYFPLTADVTARDRVLVRGSEFEVDGEPGEWRSGYGTNLGAKVVIVRRVDG